MIFKRIIIERLFSYATRQVLELDGVTPDRNICLIMGRNGFGKTSLLNAVKLLFIGVNDDRVRTIGFPPQRVGHRQFVVGDPPRWSGILNRKAYAEGHRDCSVSATWTDGNSEVTATRTWIVNDTGYNEGLELREGFQRLVDDAAHNRLSYFLPREIVPFFFFDGEQIQELAEASDEHRAREIDRVLGLSFLDCVREQLAMLVTEYRRKGLPAQVLQEIAECDAQILRLEAEREAASREGEELQREIAEAREIRDRLVAQRERLRSGGTLAEERFLKEEIDGLREEVAEDQQRLAEDLPVFAPLLANTELVRRSLEILDTLIADRFSNGIRIIETLKSNLPRALFETPPFPTPRLRPEQVAFLKDRLLKNLDVFKPTQVSGQLSLSIAAHTAETVRSLLVHMLEGSARDRDLVAHQLRDFSRKKGRLKDLEKRLIDLEASLRMTVELMSAFQVRLIK